MGNKFFILYVLVLLIIACNAQQPPQRLSNIQKAAKWYGGRDGGCWILVQRTDTINLFIITAYFDNSGEIWEKGSYTIEPKVNHVIVADSLMNYIEGFDGVTIHTNFPFDKRCQLIKLK